MTDFLIQFHALPSELAEFAQQFCKRHALHASAIYFPPYEAQPTSVETLDSLSADSRFRGLMLTPGVPRLNTTRTVHAPQLNPDAMFVDFGRLASESLGESAISSRTDDAALKALWKKMCTEWKKIARAGVEAFSPESGVSSKARTHRLTQGAIDAYGRGVALKAVGGTGQYRPATS